MLWVDLRLLDARPIAAGGGQARLRALYGHDHELFLLDKTGSSDRCTNKSSESNSRIYLDRHGHCWWHGPVYLAVELQVYLEPINHGLCVGALARMQQTHDAFLSGVLEHICSRLLQFHKEQLA